MKALEIENVCFEAEGNRVLRGISAQADYGALTGIAGPNGAGKSTLLKIAAGVLKAGSGGVRLFSENGTVCPAEKVAYVPAEISVPYDFTVRDIVLMGRNPAAPWWRDYDDKDRKLADSAIAAAGLSRFAGRAVNSLSSGERQRVMIAQALCQQATVLLMDEPTAHLDLKAENEIFSLLSSLAVQDGAAVVVVSHNINLLAGFADSIILLRDGAVFAEGVPAAAVTVENMLGAYGAAGDAQMIAGSPFFIPRRHPC